MIFVWLLGLSVLHRPQQCASFSDQFRGDVAPLNVVWKWLLAQKCQQGLRRLLRAKILLLPQGQLSSSQVNARNSGPRNDRRLLKSTEVSPTLGVVPLQAATEAAAPNLQIASIVAGQDTDYWLVAERPKHLRLGDR